MGTVIQANELEVGDLYRDYNSGSRLTPGGAIIRKVTGSREHTFTETYTVLETEDIEGRNLRGEISLRRELAVERLDEISEANIGSELRGMYPGDQLNIVYYDMRFWV